MNAFEKELDGKVNTKFNTRLNKHFRNLIRVFSNNERNNNLSSLKEKEKFRLKCLSDGMTLNEIAEKECIKGSKSLLNYCDSALDKMIYYLLSINAIDKDNESFKYYDKKGRIL